MINSSRSSSASNNSQTRDETRLRGLRIAATGTTVGSTGAAIGRVAAGAEGSVSRAGVEPATAPQGCASRECGICSSAERTTPSGPVAATFRRVPAEMCSTLNRHKPDAGSPTTGVTVYGIGCSVDAPFVAVVNSNNSTDTAGPAVRHDRTRTTAPSTLSSGSSLSDTATGITRSAIFTEGGKNAQPISSTFSSFVYKSPRSTARATASAAKRFRL